MIPSDSTGTFQWDNQGKFWYLRGSFQHDPFNKEADAKRNFDNELKKADALNKLGLLNGVGKNENGSIDYDIERTPTRLEALVMLIRLLGKDEDAKTGNWVCPFDDVPDWGKAYVSYAYENGLTNGISDTKFGVGDATAKMYLTFALRALGYDDGADKDFSWDAPEALAQKCGILSGDINTSDFTRGDLVTISYYMLRAPHKEDGRPLYEHLIDQGVFTREQYDLYME